MGWIFNFKNCRKIEIEIQSHWFWIKASHAWVDVKIHLVFFFNFWYGFLIKQVLPRNSVVRNFKKGIKVKVIVFFINKILFSNFFNNWNIKNYGYLLKKKTHWELPETKRDFLAINIYFIINFLLVKESYLMSLENQRSISRNVKSVV